MQGTVMVGCLPRSGCVGKAIIGALGSTLVKIKLPEVDHDLAYFFLQSKFIEINSRAKGVGIPHVDPNIVWNYKFPLPPATIQQQIVSKIEQLFSEADKGIEELKAAQQQLRVYRRGVSKWAFEGKLTNKNVKEGELLKGWKWVKVEAIGESFDLEKRFEVNETLKPPLKQHVKVAIDWALHNKTHTLISLEEALKKEGIQTVIRRNEEGVVYGMTYIDYKNKVVFNGSDLGKEYSAKGLIERMAQKMIKKAEISLLQRPRSNYTFLPKKNELQVLAGEKEKNSNLEKSNRACYGRSETK